MNRRDFIQGSALAAGGMWPAAATAQPAPIPEPHFPGRLYQFVWRNWELANADRMAIVAGTNSKEILRLGADLGLPPKPALTEDQLRRNYITVIRQNWHLLPEDQIVQLLGWPPKRFAFTLKEDDALDIKLGNNKPACDKLVYQRPTHMERKRAEAIRRTVQKHFGPALYDPGEKRFQFVEDLSAFHYPSRRDAGAAAQPGEVDLSRGWTIVAQGEILEAAAARLAHYLSSAMGCETAAAQNGSRRIVLSAGVADLGRADSFRLNVEPSEIRIDGGDTSGVLQGVYWLQDRMEQRGGPFLKLGDTRRRAVWNPRFAYSYFALYGDPLMEAEADPFPDAYLERLARDGVNGVWIQGVLNTLAPSPVFPEFGAGAGTRLKNLRALTARAKRLGVNVYLYMNEPRAMPPSFFERHPEVRGSSNRGLYAICTSVPKVREWIAGGLAHIFEQVPDLGGIFCITMSENHTNCFSHGGAWGDGTPNAGDCPRCSKRDSWVVISELIATFRDGVRRSSATAEVIAWDWGWGTELARRAIPLLPKDVPFMSISEWDAPVDRGGVQSRVGEYSISVVGPGPRALRNWGWARESGLRTMAKVQLNNTWEISAVPYIPAMDLILEHCENLTREHIGGILFSWTCGGYASPNLSAAKAYDFDGPSSRADILLAAAIGRYGASAGPVMAEAWHKFSEAFREFPYGVAIYVIPTQHGPANLLRLNPTGYRPGMILFPHDAYLLWCGKYPPAVAQSQFAKLAALWREGMAAFERGLQLVPSNRQSAAQLDLAVALTCSHHFESVANQLEFYILREESARAGGEARVNARARMRQIAEQEMELARRQYPVARRHSVIGYEASNHYYYTPLDLVEKYLNCQQVIDEIDGIASE